MNFTSAEELDLFCRLCFQRSKHLVDILSNNCSVPPNEMSLSAKILACVSIEVSSTSKGPKKICTKCLNFVNSWYEFKLSCDSTSNALQKYLQDIEKNKSVPEKTLAPEDSILFPEISLFSSDSLLERSLSVGSNISSLVNYFFNSEKPKEKSETEQVPNLITNFSKQIEVTNFNEQIEVERPNESELIEITYDSSLEDETSKDDKTSRRKKGYDCELCNEHFTHFSMLLTHDESNHSSIPRTFSCLDCGRMFILPDRLATHMKLAHREKSFQCPICDKYFVSSKSLKVHSRLHSEMYKCEKCGYLSTSKLYLNQHMQKHEGVDISFTCNICQKKFSQNSSLRRHQNLHSKTLGKCYKCSLCHLLFRSHSELISHTNAHNGIVTDEVFRCRICGKTFKSKKVLTVHQRLHQDPQFSCSVCEKKLKSKYDLRVHAETHSDSKTFDCFHCTKKFSFKNTLIRHVKKHYPRIRSDVIL